MAAASETKRLDDACEATVRMRRAAEARDAAGVVGTMAEGVVLRSPITGRVPFHGRDEVAEIVTLVFSVLNGVQYFADVGDQRTRALFYRAWVGREPVEEAMRVELNDVGEIEELTIFYRPLPGLTSFAAVLAPKVARSRHGPIRSLVARLLIRPLALLTRLADRLVPWLA